MAPKFGTSGLRGLVTELTPDCVGRHVAAFVSTCPVGTGLFVAHDLRPSSPSIADTVADAAKAAGLQVTMCGAVPTPALALAAMRASAAAVMVTGSHIPADRNGLKFYTPAGEITKMHEQAITGALGLTPQTVGGPPFKRDETAGDKYIGRYLAAYDGALLGKRIGVYAHSAVGRELLSELLMQLGADVVTLGRSETFVPVDTEAVDTALRNQLRGWAIEHRCDAIVSTDGDGDRPLLTDANGTVVPGDILGQITADAMAAEIVVTPVSSNAGVNESGRFAQVIRTKIGSPFVISAMVGVQGRVVGYEANGGFLLGFQADGPSGPLPTLMTRDAFLPILAVLAASKDGGVATRVAAEPARFTAAGLLRDVPPEQSQALIQRLISDADARVAFLKEFDGVEMDMNLVDGVRMTLSDHRIVHLRPSGNAPELRLYVEAERATLVDEMLHVGLASLRGMLLLRT